MSEVTFSKCQFWNFKIRQFQLTDNFGKCNLQQPRNINFGLWKLATWNYWKPLEDKTLKSICANLISGYEAENDTVNYKRWL